MFVMESDIQNEWCIYLKIGLQMFTDMELMYPAIFFCFRVPKCTKTHLRAFVI